MAALLVVTLAKWIEPLYGDTSERFAKAFLWMFTSLNVLSTFVLVSPGTLKKYLTTDMRGLNILAVAGVWLLASVFVFGWHSVSQLAAGARIRWPVIAGRENWITAMYCVLTVVILVCATAIAARRV